MNAPLERFPQGEKHTVIVTEGEKRFGSAIDLERYCEARGYPFQELAKAEGELNEYFMRGREFIAYVENVQVISDGFLVTADGIITRGLAHANYHTSIEKKLVGYKGRQESAEPEIEEAVLVWGNENFSHFIFQFLTRAALCFKKPFLLDKPILLKRGLPPSYVEWMERLGFTKFIYADDWVRVKRLWVPSVCCYRGNYEDELVYLSDYACHALREKLTVEKKGPERVYLSRQGAKHRRVLNEDELLAKLPGFEVVEMEGLSVQEQLEAVSNAKFIVLTVGGTSAITMFAPRDCTIIEMSNPYMVGTFGSTAWASILGQTFYRIHGKQVGDSSPRIDLDFNVDTELIRALIIVAQAMKTPKLA